MLVILCVLSCFGFGAYFLNPQKIAYNVIYFYSNVQILINNLKNIFKSEPKTITNEYYHFEMINDTQIDEFIDFKEDFDNEPNFIFSKHPDSKIIIFNDGVNKIFYHKPFENITSSKYEISNVSFISFKIFVNSKEYNIRLSTPEYNFYIVNNEINFQWVKYYFKKYLNINLIDTTEYSVEIIDENVNFINISQNDSIKFKKETYEINKYE